MSRILNIVLVIVLAFAAGAATVYFFGPVPSCGGKCCPCVLPK